MATLQQGQLPQQLQQQVKGQLLVQVLLVVLLLLLVSAVRQLLGDVAQVMLLPLLSGLAFVHQQCQLKVTPVQSMIHWRVLWNMLASSDVLLHTGNCQLWLTNVIGNSPKMGNACCKAQPEWPAFW